MPALRGRAAAAENKLNSAFHFGLAAKYIFWSSR